MQPQTHHAGFGAFLKLLLALGVIAALISVFGPLARESQSPSSYEWNSESQPTAARTPETAPSGAPAGQETGEVFTGEGPVSVAAERPTDIPRTEGPVEAGLAAASPWGLTGDDAYDCTVMGTQLASVSLASIKTFMDRAYENFLSAEQRADSMTAQQEKQSYATAQTDLEKKKWRCFHCANEIGCSEQ